MKKSLLVTIEFPPQIGGVSSYYKNLCDHLPADDIVVLAQETPKNYYDEKSQYKVYRKKLFWKNTMVWPKWLRAISCIHDIVKKEKIEVILAGQILPVGSLAYFYKLRSNIPYFIFCHGMDIAHLRGRKKLLARTFIRQAKGIITNSIFTKHLIEKFQYPHHHIIPIYPCPEILPQPPDLEIARIKNLYNLHNKRILLTVGRLVSRKGHALVLASLPEILKKFPNVVYIIVGDGPNKSYLKSLTEKYKLEDHVIFTGIIEKETVSAMYEMCEIFVMPSQSKPSGDVEGFGTVFLEANLFAKPVIAGKGGGVEEAVIHKKTGLIVNPENSEELKNACIRLLSDTHVASKLGTQGFYRVHSDFQWHKEAEKIIKMLS